MTEIAEGAHDGWRWPRYGADYLRLLGMKDPMRTDSYGRPQILGVKLEITERSKEYKAGVLALLRRRIDGVPIKCPYLEGTASFDAFYSGIEEGWLVMGTSVREPYRACSNAARKNENR
jgi:hypothetical protein